MRFIYKHKRGCTNEKNTCTNDPDSLGSKFKNWVSGEMYLISAPMMYAGLNMVDERSIIMKFTDKVIITLVCGTMEVAHDEAVYTPCLLRRYFAVTLSVKFKIPKHWESRGPMNFICFFLRMKCLLFSTCSV